jgi:PadR family transcriptional regulator, regulatory protein AphA
MELSSTAYVILGLLRDQPRTGYEIKAAVDRSTRFFWAASYGQIYPELKRLAAHGLVRGTARSQGRRSRTVYSLTARGRQELIRWLEEPAEVLELRDEGLLKLFFADALPPEATVEALAAKRDRHAANVERLREIEREAAAEKDDFECMVLRYGIAMNEWISEWCERERSKLVRETRREAKAA